MSVRVSDQTVGICSHGLPCCPHSISGTYVMGSPNVNDNKLPTARLSDITVHTCPHCGVGMAIQASRDVNANKRGVTRLGDAVTEFCGAGVNVTGSPDVSTNKR